MNKVSYILSRWVIVGLLTGFVLSIDRCGKQMTAAITFLLTQMKEIIYNKIITCVIIGAHKMNHLPTVSEAEYEVMKIIWAYAPISTNEVVEKLSTTSYWTPKTIHTLLSRLVKKGVLNYRKDSRVFVYMPLVKKENYVAQESNNFLKRFYDGRLNAMVVNFLEQDKLAKDDIIALKKLLEEKMNSEL